MNVFPYLPYVTRTEQNVAEQEQIGPVDIRSPDSQTSNTKIREALHRYLSRPSP